MTTCTELVEFKSSWASEQQKQPEQGCFCFANEEHEDLKDGAGTQDDEARGGLVGELGSRKIS